MTEPVFYSDAAALSTALADKVARFRGVFILADSTTRICLSAIPFLRERTRDSELVVVPSGESSKSIQSCERIWEWLLANHAGKDSVLINVGGGMITDLGGFVASAYKRGMPFIHIPTSVMAMADAAIGGKTAVDFAGVKNSLGTFANPDEILICTDLLKTLPRNEWLSGFIEIVKHALLSDLNWWKKLSSDSEWNMAGMEPHIRRSSEFKCSVVKRDPFERGERKILNAGHTAGHALESMLLTRNPVSHGNAVAWGLCLECLISTEMGWLSSESCSEVIHLLLGLFPDKRLQVSDFDELWSLMLNDKKNEGSNVVFSLLQAIGEPAPPVQIEREKCYAAYILLLREMKSATHTLPF